MVNEYWDVFWEELPGLAPAWEIDFVIELYSKTAPISIPPYRITPIEKQELNKLLDELLTK